LKLLLDTHIWLWSLQDPKRLGKRVQQELRNSANELWLSPISTWEALTLNAKGKIRLRGNLTECANPRHGATARGAFDSRDRAGRATVATATRRSCGSLSGSYRAGIRFDSRDRRQRSAGPGRNRDPGQPLRLFHTSKNTQDVLSPISISTSRCQSDSAWA